jgi:S1-C subfamily serine protease
MGFQVRVVDPSRPLEAAQGTGFAIGGAWLLTCAHVVGDQKAATITLAGKRLVADVVKADAKADLALLKLREPLPEGAQAIAFRTAAKPAAMGEEVSTIGYPLSRILGNSARMTRGLLSATAGLRDDDQQVQVSAEIQPGNSGGPLLDRDGHVIGVVNKTINPSAVARATGGALAYDRAGALESASKGVAKVQAGIVAADSERRDKMVVRLTYVSHLDVWYRFRVFMLQAFDYETQEGLFVAGQGRDNMVSNEDVVIRDTMAQFKKAVSAR